MANKNLTILIILALLFFTGIFAWLHHQSQSRYDWQERNSEQAYVLESSEPYGLKIMRNVLASYFSEYKIEDLKSSYVKELPIDSTGQSTFFFTGEAIGSDSVELAHLLDFVAAGNTAFISSKSLPGELSTQLYYEDCDDYVWSDYESEYNAKDSFPVVFYRDTEVEFSFFYSYRNQNQPYFNHFIPSDIFYCESEDTYTSLGYVESDFKVNFAKFPYGSGQFYLHSTPIAFTNFHLLRKEGKAYCESILGFLPPGTVYWDGFSHVTELEGRRRNRNRGYNRKLPPDNPLSTLLTNKGLAWAWYLSLVLGILFVFFKGKRRQRTIPILPKNNNTSMEFIETIAQLHFKEKNYKGIAIQKMRLFLAHLRERYGLHIHPNEDSNHVLPSTEQLEQLVRLSEVPEEKTSAIFKAYTAIIDYEPTDEMLVDFYQAVEQFQLRAK